MFRQQIQNLIARFIVKKPNLTSTNVSRSMVRLINTSLYYYADESQLTNCVHANINILVSARVLLKTISNMHLHIRQCTRTSAVCKHASSFVPRPNSRISCF